MIDITKIKGVLFDMDGTLVDTENLHLQAWNAVLKPYGATLSKEECIRRFTGRAGTLIEEDLLKEHGIELTPLSLLEKKEALILEWMKTKELPLMPFAIECVDYFVNKGFKVGVVSGGGRDETDVKIKRTGLSGKFITSVTSSEVTESKPNPESYLMACKQISLDPSTCLAIEDTNAGLASAKAAGLSCFAVPNEFTQSHDFSTADQTFKSLQNIITFFKDL
jgi:beta-phosphoglucomutase